MSRTKNKTRRNDAIITAKQLGYPKNIIERLRRAENDHQIDRILKDGRMLM